MLTLISYRKRNFSINHHHCWLVGRSVYIEKKTSDPIRAWKCNLPTIQPTSRPTDEHEGSKKLIVFSYGISCFWYIFNNYGHLFDKNIIRFKQNHWYINICRESMNAYNIFNALFHTIVFGLLQVAVHWFLLPLVGLKIKLQRQCKGFNKTVKLKNANISKHICFLCISLPFAFKFFSNFNLIFLVFNLNIRP